MSSAHQITVVSLNQLVRTSHAKHLTNLFSIIFVKAN
ncbi:hypothetical protein Sarmat_00891 [Rickettsiales endosymbiont of Paramecium tredecaurelia]|nr:IS5 family transposase domain protein [Candidatus Sarmatiella mevalonica]MBL3285027.1 hypothetical protein [Candidatus Sarmatiella mevalonica]